MKGTHHHRLQRGGFGRGGGRRGFGPGFGQRFGPGFGPGAGFGPGRGRGEGPDVMMGPGFGSGFGPGFGPAFGPGFGFGPGPRGFGRPEPEDGEEFGRRGHRGGRGRGRRGRVNVRAAVLALLAEQPRHGYAIMTELAERSGGMWRPSPGSVYPVLQQLQDEGLVTSTESDGKKVFALTDAGQSLVQENPEEFHEPWHVADSGGRARFRALFEGVGGLGAATREVARHGTPEQFERAVTVLDDARRAMYAILAEDAPSTPAEADGPADSAVGEAGDG